MGKTDKELKAHLSALMTRDSELLQALQSLGVDLSKRRVLDLTFWAPDQSSAEGLTESLLKNEIPEATASPSASRPGRWIVRAKFEASPEFIAVKENVATFVLIADKYDCDYDGWGTAVIEAAQNRSTNQG